MEKIKESVYIWVKETIISFFILFFFISTTVHALFSGKYFGYEIEEENFCLVSEQPAKQTNLFLCFFL